MFPIQRTMFLAVVLCATSSLAGEPAAEELPPARDEPILIRRLVVLNRTTPELAAHVYDKVDYTLKLRQLNNDIRLTSARLNALRTRADEYDRRFGYTNALLVTRQETHLDILDLELQLKQLRAERALMKRYRTEQVQLRAALVEAGARVDYTQTP